MQWKRPKRNSFGNSSRRCNKYCLLNSHLCRCLCVSVIRATCVSFGAVQCDPMGTMCREMYSVCTDSVWNPDNVSLLTNQTFNYFMSALNLSCTVRYSAIQDDDDEKSAEIPYRNIAANIIIKWGKRTSKKKVHYISFAKLFGALWRVAFLRNLFQWNRATWSLHLHLHHAYNCCAFA